MPGGLVGWRVAGGMVLVGLGLLIGRRLRQQRHDLFDLTGLRNGHRALAVGPINGTDLAAIETMLSPDGRLVEILPDDQGSPRRQIAGRLSALLSDGLSACWPLGQLLSARLSIRRPHGRMGSEACLAPTVKALDREPKICLASSSQDYADSARDAGQTDRLVCEPSRPPFQPETFDAIVLLGDSWVGVLVSLLKPAGLLSLVQRAGSDFRPAAMRRRQLIGAGLEVIDAPGRGLSYVINARRPIYPAAAR